MDDQDRRLIDLLRGNARLSTAELARALGVARSTVQNRMARLERDGIIAGYTLRMGEAARAPLVRAHVMIAVEPGKARLVEQTLRRVAGLAALFSVSGQYDFIAIVEAARTEALDTIIDHIRDLEGVRETNTAILLSTKLAHRP